MIQNQQSMIFSPYMAIYDLVVPKDNLLRKINDLVYFLFVYDELKDNYCLVNGRNAIDPIRMFKYLLLKTVFDLSDVAIEKEIIKSKSIIVDATHTKARYNQMSPREILMDRSKKLRKAIYQIDENMKNKFPTKNTSDNLENELQYCQKLIDVIEKEEVLTQYPKI